MGDRVESCAPGSARDDLCHATPHRDATKYARLPEHADAADRSDAAEVVAVKIDRHRELRALLSIAVESESEREVSARVRSAGARPLDGGRAEAITPDLQRELRARRADACVAEVGEEPVRRGRCAIAPRKDVARVTRADFEVDRASHVHLVDVPGRNTLENRTYAVGMSAIRFVGREKSRIDRRLGEVRGEPPRDRTRQPLGGARVIGLDAHGTRRVIHANDGVVPHPRRAGEDRCGAIVG